MRITAIETIVFDRAITVHAGSISWLWVRLYTGEGLVGLGETYPTATAAEAVVRESLAPRLLGEDARNRERLWSDLFLAVRHHGWAGAEIRAPSAIDLALESRGQGHGPTRVSPAQRTRDRIRTYQQEYRGLVTHAYPAVQGTLGPPEAPELGVELDPSLFARPGLRVRRTELTA